MKRKNNKFSKFGSWLRNSNPLVFSATLIIISWIGSTIISAPVELGWVEDIVFKESPLESANNNFGFLFLTAVIIAPLAETLLFQMLPFWVFRKAQYFCKHRFAVVALSGIIFGLQHYYSLLYMIITIFIGMILMYGYTVKWRKHAFWNVTLMHALWNLHILLIDRFID